MSRWGQQQDTPKESDFNAPVSGGKMLQNGEHPVKISAVEFKELSTGTPVLNVSVENDDGKTLRAAVFPLTRDGKQTVMFRNFISALFGCDPGLAVRFVTQTYTKPELFESLAGLSLQVEVVPGRRGYNLVKFGDIIKAIDVQSEEELFEGKEFEDYDAAKLFVDVHNEQHPDDKVYRAFPEFSSKFRMIEEEADANKTILQAVITEAETGKPASGATGGVGGGLPKAF